MFVVDLDNLWTPEQVVAILTRLYPLPGEEVKRDLIIRQLCACACKMSMAPVWENWQMIAQRAGELSDSVDNDTMTRILSLLSQYSDCDAEYYFQLCTYLKLKPLRLDPTTSSTYVNPKHIISLSLIHMIDFFPDFWKNTVQFPNLYRDDEQYRYYVVFGEHIVDAIDCWKYIALHSDYFRSGIMADVKGKGSAILYSICKTAKTNRVIMDLHKYCLQSKMTQQYYIVPVSDRRSYERLYAIFTQLKVIQIGKVDSGVQKKLPAPTTADFTALGLEAYRLGLTSFNQIHSLLLTLRDSTDNPLGLYAGTVLKSPTSINTVIKTVLSILTHQEQAGPFSEPMTNALRWETKLLQEFSTHYLSKYNIVEQELDTQHIFEVFTEWCYGMNAFENLLVKQNIDPVSFASAVYQVFISNCRRGNLIVLYGENRRCGKTIIGSALKDVFDGKRLALLSYGMVNDFQVSDAATGGMVVFEDLSRPGITFVSTHMKPHIDGDDITLDVKYDKVKTGRFPPAIITTNETDLDCFETRMHKFYFPNELSKILKTKIDRFDKVEVLKFLAKYLMFPQCNALYHLPKSSLYNCMKTCDHPSKCTMHSANCRFTEYCSAIKESHIKCTTRMPWEAFRLQLSAEQSQQYLNFASKCATPHKRYLEPLSSLNDDDPKYLEFQQNKEKSLLWRVLLDCQHYACNRPTEIDDFALSPLEPSLLLSAAHKSAEWTKERAKLSTFWHAHSAVYDEFTSRTTCGNPIWESRFDNEDCEQPDASQI